MNAVREQIGIESIDAPASRGAPVQRYTPLAVWVVVVLTLLFISLRIMSWGFVPAGDARRHVAKAFTDKAYTEIAVMRPEYTMDHSPGWEGLLRVVRRAAGWERDALMSFALVFTMLCVLLAPLPWLRRPEAWLAALLAKLAAEPDTYRITQARPYLLTEAVLIAILFAWSGEESKRPGRWKVGLTVVGMALSVWMHGAWYLWVLPLAAFFLAGRWRAGCWLTACWAAGTVGGAMLTGRPVEFLRQAVLIAATISRQQVPQWTLVGELQPDYRNFPVLLLVAVVALWRFQRDKSAKNVLGGPVFWLIAIGWILGFKASRFWGDWGMAAVLVWLTVQLQEMMANGFQANSWKRVAMAGLLAVPLFADSTNDLEGRYSYSLSEVHLDARDPALAGWLPGPEGIFYSASMEFFDDTFYWNPQANWRYIFGMEPALMPKADRQILARIQVSHAAKDYEPWVQKMRPVDRLEITSAGQPNLPQLEWTNVAAQMWIGRLPKAK
jgi:hypothetical protein